MQIATPVAASHLVESSGPPTITRPSFLSNLLTVAGGQVACAAIAVITEICYARLLGPAGRGQISLCLMAIAFGVLVGGLGCEIPITLWAADAKKKSSEWLPAVIFWGLLGSSIASFLWSFIYWHLHPSFLKGATPALAVLVLVSIPPSVFLGYLLAILAGLERFRIRAIVALADQSIGLLGVIALVIVFGRKTEMAVLGNLAGIILGAIFAAILLRQHFQRPTTVSATKKYLRPSLSLGLRGQLGNLAAFFNYRLDVFIVNYFLDPAQVGIYAIGVVVSEALWQLPSAAALALFPRTARTLDHGAAEFTCLIVRQVFLLAFVSGLIIAVLSPIFIPLIFGARFRPAVAVIWWILPGTVALSVGKVAAADLAARGKPQYSSIFAFIALVVTVALDLIAIPRMGIQGAALASSASYLLIALLLAGTLKRELRISWKSLFIPSYAEISSYRDVFWRCKAWLFPESVAAGK